MGIQTPVSEFERYYSILNQLGDDSDYLFLGNSIESPKSNRHCCDVCGDLIAWGSTRYRCMECFQLDLCSSCALAKKQTQQHASSHAMFQVEEIAALYNCDVCEQIINPHDRYHCLECIDYDLCPECHQSSSHGHSFVLL